MSDKRYHRSYSPKRPLSNTKKINTSHINKALLDKKRRSSSYPHPNGKQIPYKKDASNTSAILVFASIIAVLVLIFFSLKMLKPDGAVAETTETIAAVASDTTSTDQTQADFLTPETVTDETEVIEIETETERIIADPPVMYGITPLTVYAGNTISYKSGIYLKSEVDDDPMLKVDNSKVDLFTPGVYEVTYTATDKYGNSASETTTLTVLADDEYYSEEEIEALAADILDSLITDDMTDERKCLEVYRYLHNLNYVDVVYSEDWMQNAYRMLRDRAGDCFGYYSAARLLLTQLGYDVMEIENNNGFTHYWCLVSIDGGETWWHFDATCWSWGEDGILCLVSDKYITAYANRHLVGVNCSNHSWDRDKFPATPEEDFWTDEDRSIIYSEGYPSYLSENYNDYSDDWSDYQEDDSWDYSDDYDDTDTRDESYDDPPEDDSFPPDEPGPDENAGDDIIDYSDDQSIDDYQGEQSDDQSGGDSADISENFENTEESVNVE